MEVKKKPHRYTDEQIEFIKANVKGRLSSELTELFNRKFGLNLSVGQIRNFKSYRGLTNEMDTRFKKGVCTYRCPKGTRISPATEFKKGNIPANYRPVGSERITVDGYVEVKIADPNKWKLKHVVLWEQTNGPIPKGYCILFADNNPQNLDLNNMILIKRSQLLIMNKKGLIKKDPNLTRTGVILADLIDSTNKKRRK